MKKRTNQLHLIPKEKRFFGGELLHGKRRSQRPLNSKESLHVVIRSSWATGKHSFLNKANYCAVNDLIRGIARKYKVKVYRKAVVGNHIHLIIKFKYRRDYVIFIRVLSSMIASHVMKGQSFKVFKKALDREWGDPLKRQETQGLEQQFWQFRPFSRILAWGRDFKNMCEYLEQNILEAIGFIRYKKRKNHYAKYLKGRSP